MRDKEGFGAEEKVEGTMSSRERKRASLYKKFQQLRSVTNSSALSINNGAILAKGVAFLDKTKIEIRSSRRAEINTNKVNKTSIIVDASKYIAELKEKVERLNEDVATSKSSSGQSSLPMVTVETLEKGFLINVFSEKNCPGLLVSILEAFDELGLDVLDASVSCSDSFRLEAVGGENQGQDDSIDAQVVKQAVLEAIRNWNESS